MPTFAEIIEKPKSNEFLFTKLQGKAQKKQILELGVSVEGWFQPLPMEGLAIWANG